MNNSGFMSGLAVIIAIAGIVVMEITALNHGIDGTLLLASVAIIAGLAGYKVDKLVKALKGQPDAEPKPEDKKPE